MLWKGNIHLLKQILSYAAGKTEQVSHIIWEGAAAVVGSRETQCLGRPQTPINLWVQFCNISVDVNRTQRFKQLSRFRNLLDQIRTRPSHPHEVESNELYRNKHRLFDIAISAVIEDTLLFHVSGEKKDLSFKQSLFFSHTDDVLFSTTNAALLQWNSLVWNPSGVKNTLCKCWF